MMKYSIFLLILFIEGCCILPINRQPPAEEYGINLKASKCSNGYAKGNSCVINIEEGHLSIDIVFITNADLYPNEKKKSLFFQFFIENETEELDYQLEFDNPEIYFDQDSFNLWGEPVSISNDPIYEFNVEDSLYSAKNEKLTFNVDLIVNRKDGSKEIFPLTFISKEMKVFKKILKEQ